MADRGEKLQEALTAARETVTSLEGKKASAERELTRLMNAKGPLVLPAATGDKAKSRHLGELNTRIIEQRLHVEDLGAAIEQATRQIEGIEHELERAGDADKAEELAGCHDELLADDREADAIMAQLAQVLDRRAGRIKQCQRLMDRRLLRRLGIDEDLGNDLGWQARKGPATRAARKAGLAAYIDIPWAGQDAAMAEVRYPQIGTVLKALRHGPAEQREAA